MAPPNFPQGMTLHSIGYAALKYPQLPPELPVPLSNQLGVLQRLPSRDQNHAIAQIASQYLPALLEFQSSDNPLLHDPSSSQYYFSDALSLLNILTSSLDVCIRVAKHPAILNDIVDKLLDPNLETAMRACNRTIDPEFAPSTFESDFGCMLQFVSTILLYHPDHLETLPPRINELVPKLKNWEKTYKRNSVKTISNASSRLVTQIQGMESSQIEQIRDNQAQTIVCGAAACGKREGLTACATCRIQRYCGKDHQRQDWKYHKYICNKGLVEVTE